MAIIPINVARVSQNLKSFNLLATVRASQVGLFRVQNQLATGLKFLTPSEDASKAAHVLGLERTLERVEQVNNNLRDANAALLTGEAAMQEAIDLIMEARTRASETVGDSFSAAERQSIAVVIDSIINQMVAIGNRQHVGSYLFSGHRSGAPPFEQNERGIQFNGDAGRWQTIVDLDLSEDAFKVSGLDFFQAASEGVKGFVDLDPALTFNTRIGDLRGTTGNGIRLGQIDVSDGSTQTRIDLSGAATVGDMIDKLNAEMPASLTASINAIGIVITAANPPVGPISITDVGSGQTARDLGVYAVNNNIGSVGGADLDPVLTPRTRLADLHTGAGIDLSGGIKLEVGNASAIVTFDGAETIEDVLNRINTSGLGVEASIADDGNTINVVNRVSGADMSIGENGAAAATNLGIRSNYGGTLLSDLNDGRGVQTVDGDDIRVVTRDGSTIDVDVDGLRTVQEVIDRFNTAGGGAITASLKSTGNGIVITDNTAGAGSLRIERLNVSPAIDGLGLDVQASGAALVGVDANPQRVNGAFTALKELRTALLDDDTRGINGAAQRLEEVLDLMQEAQGRMASLARVMEERNERMLNTSTATQVMLSDVRDVDIAEAIVGFQQMQNALQANLSTASRVLSLSLLDFLR